MRELASIEYYSYQKKKKQLYQNRMLALKLWKNFDFWLIIMILIDFHIPKNNGNVTKEWERLEFECNDWKRKEIKKMMDATVTTIFFSLKRVKMLEILCVQRILMAEFENFCIKNSIIH